MTEPHHNSNTIGNLSSSLRMLGSLEPKQISFDLLNQLEFNRAAMHKLADNFSDEQSRLIHRSIDVAIFCHYGHTRAGDTPVHYSHHLLEVMKRVSEMSRHDHTEAQIGQPLLAIQLSAAVLHDSMEDIVKTFPDITDRQEGFLIVEQYIRSKLEDVTEKSTIDKICEAILTLSIKNEADFSDSQYISEISKSEICRPIKWADINHNMITMPYIYPVAGAVSCPAQYGKLMEASPYHNEFIKQVLVSAVRSRQQATTPVPNEADLSNALRELYEFEGLNGFVRLKEFYNSVRDRLTNGSEDQNAPSGYNVGQLLEAIDYHILAIDAAMEALRKI